MRILIDISHPGHVHLFKNAYFKLIAGGHEIFITVRDIPIAKRLLDHYDIPYYDLGRKGDSILGKAFTVLKQDLAISKLVRKKKIKLGISSGIVLGHVSIFSKMESLMFDDDDDKAEPLIVKFGHPFSSAVISPACINRKTHNLIGYEGIHELAYLHPDYFTPDERVIREAGLAPSDTYFILRFVSFKAHHDYGQSGITLSQKKRIVNLLKPHGKVFITAESKIEPDLEAYRLPVPPEKVHSFIYYSTIFLGDSQTMTSEAAILGVPALKCNSFAGELSVPNELEKKYDLCYSYRPENFEKFFNHIEELLTHTDLKKEWHKKRDRFLKDKIDVTAFMVWLIENWPKSASVMKEDPDYQLTFK
jgi:predicted glycosyltransferase